MPKTSWPVDERLLIAALDGLWRTAGAIKRRAGPKAGRMSDAATALRSLAERGLVEFRRAKTFVHKRKSNDRYAVEFYRRGQGVTELSDISSVYIKPRVGRARDENLRRYAPSPIVDMLTNIRRNASISQKQLATKMGYNASVISEVEANRRRPRIDILEMWANTLGYDLVLQKKP